MIPYRNIYSKYGPFDALILSDKDGYAVAVTGDGELISKSLNHWKVIQETFNNLENQAKTTGVRVILWPKFGPFKIESGQSGIHIPCENGGHWHISAHIGAPTKTINGFWYVIIHEGSGPVIENDNANVYTTRVTIENLDVLLNSKNANGLKIYSLMLARQVYVEYNGGLGEPDVKTFGIAFRNGNAFTIEQCYVINTHVGFLSLGSEHGTLITCHYATSGWGEFGYLIPSDVGWAPLAALEDAGYPKFTTSSRHCVLINCHFYGTGKTSTYTTPNGYTVVPCAFRVAQSTLIFPKIEGGEIYRGFQCDLDTLIINPYVTGTVTSLFAGGYYIVSTIYQFPYENYTLHALLGKTIVTWFKGFVTPIVTGVVSVPAGGTYVVARFTVPSGRKLRIHTIAELYDPDDQIIAEIYNVTDGVTVASVDGWSDVGWTVSEGKTVEFRLVNSDANAAHYGNYAFLISML